MEETIVGCPDLRIIVPLRLPISNVKREAKEFFPLSPYVSRLTPYGIQTVAFVQNHSPLTVAAPCWTQGSQTLTPASPSQSLIFR